MRQVIKDHSQWSAGSEVLHPAAHEELLRATLEVYPFMLTPCEETSDSVDIFFAF